MAKIHVKLKDGRTGTIEQSQFDPNSMTMDYTFPQKAVKAIPGMGTTAGAITGGLLGGTAGSIVPGAGTLAGGVLGSAGGGAIGAGAGYALKDLLGPMVGLPRTEAPQALKESAGAVAGGAATGALGELLGFAGGKVLPSALSKVKGFLPKSIRKSATELAGNAWAQVEKVLSTKAGQTKTIAVSKVVSVLDKLKAEATKAGADDVLTDIAMIENKVTKLGGDTGLMSAEQAQYLSKFIKEGKKLFSAKGVEKEMTNSGLRAAKATSTELSSQVKSQMPEIQPMLKDYGQLKNLSTSMKTPTSGYGKAFIPGVIAAPMGFGISAPVTAGTAMLAMPWTRFLLQRLLSGGLKAAGAGTKAIPALNSLFGLTQ